MNGREASVDLRTCRIAPSRCLPGHVSGRPRDRTFSAPGPACSAKRRALIWVQPRLWAATVPVCDSAQTLLGIVDILATNRLARFVRGRPGPSVESLAKLWVGVLLVVVIVLFLMGRL